MAEAEVLEPEVIEGEVMPEVSALVRVSAEPTAMSLMQLALEKQVDVEVLERIVALQERWMDRNARAAYIAALSRFQEECPPIIKESSVGFPTKAGGQVEYHYADLATIVRIIKPALARNGLSKSWDSEELDGERVRIVCKIQHIDGHCETASFTCMAKGSTKAGMNSIQEKGSAITYGMRYSLVQALGLITETDTDAHGPAPGGAPVANKEKWESAKGKVDVPMPRGPAPEKPPDLEPAVVVEYADQARHAILDTEDPQVMSNAIATLGKCYGQPKDEVMLAVKTAGASRENPLNTEMALEAVNTLQTWYEGDRKMKEGSGEWEPEPPSDEEPPPYEESVSPVEESAPEQDGSVPLCPKCHKSVSVIKGKPEYGGGWVCWNKVTKYHPVAGCGHAWGEKV